MVIMAVLLFRPQGLFGTRLREDVACTDAPDRTRAFRAGTWSPARAGGAAALSGDQPVAAVLAGRHAARRSCSACRRQLEHHLGLRRLRLARPQHVPRGRARTPRRSWRCTPGSTRSGSRRSAASSRCAGDGDRLGRAAYPGHAFVIITIALLLAAQIVATNWRSRSPTAPTASPSSCRSGTATSRTSPSTYHVLVLLALTVLFSALIRRTKFGTGLVAIREDEGKAAAIGVNTTTVQGDGVRRAARSSSAWPAACTRTS